MGLRGRCHAQRDMQEESQRDDFACSAALYLPRMDVGSARSVATARSRMGNATRGGKSSSQYRCAMANFGAGDIDDGDGDGDDRRRLREFANWFNNPEPAGLSVERLTRHGNILYRVQ